MTEITVNGESLELSEVEDEVARIERELDAIQAKAEAFSEALRDRKEYLERSAMPLQVSEEYSDVCELDRRIGGIELRLEEEYE